MEEKENNESYTIEEIKSFSITKIINLIKTTENVDLKELLEQEYKERVNSL
jgi:hypothetical protein